MILFADYVLAHYGTGAVMGVPSGDERDYAFATKFQLPIPIVLKPADGREWDFSQRPFDDYDHAIAVNSKNDKVRMIERQENDSEHNLK